MRAVCFSLACLLSTAHAGRRYVEEVFVYASGAHGSLGDARASADSIQFISCTLDCYGGYCVARDAMGNMAACLTADTEQENIIAAVHANSYISFVAGASGYCDSLEVENGSYYRPPMPTPIPPATSFRDHIFPILDDHACSRCHTGMPLDFTGASAAFARLDGATANFGVCSGQPYLAPSGSVLLARLSGMTCGERMPRSDHEPWDARYLVDAELAYINDWLMGGAAW